jgi:hypothetical protein
MSEGDAVMALAASDKTTGRLQMESMRCSGLGAHDATWPQHSGRILTEQSKEIPRDLNLARTLTESNI